MKIGLGLPTADPTALVTWARRADASRFSTLALLDRLVYDNPEPLVALGAIVGATTRIRVQTEVLIAPVRETALLAKQAATLDRLSGGRFTLGIGVGARDDDFHAAGVDPRQRGRRLDEQMAQLRRIWAGEPHAENVGPIGPAPARSGGPEVLFGGFVAATVERVARWGDGFLGAGAPPEGMDGLFRAVERSWQEHGRSGRPRLVAQANAVLGPDTVVDEARKNIRAYYQFFDNPDQVADAMLTTPEQVRAAITGFTDIGADEVMLYCWSADPDQVDRLADVVF
ncbi:LLM class flavin-dependent oxidoreductase [Goodfellowiella coeruleoviolacea]|uniref:Flavin-dependent oxidoreductase, luciferase family (Includes alkanesulfonate monooxygenase SsuD and methylene tetrahydromethanopterin reductase) n=1 Tax=Goodfellowiella coeruleoviolacea TaxID=334858 RepID=A0AAE3GBZ9_9PSEU|nr:LLM class flavin-dependent oxidoreductase [Goodfellowiella coeruleoviolacea]MCP2165436.1 Flavin-dependent oxidoreductase, luciferase family (includes alkanesulfonate monooxygenase SsuD and methylene tetrahydromethanopterin reductase) [Goodfellowiella coeruleoviolacea]